MPIASALPTRGPFSIKLCQGAPDRVLFCQRWVTAVWQRVRGGFPRAVPELLADAYLAEVPLTVAYPLGSGHSRLHFVRLCDLGPRTRKN